MNSRKKRTISIRTLYFAVGACIVCILATLLGSCYLVSRDTKRSEDSLSSQQSLISHLAAQMTLPDEIPTIATVSDPSKLSDQPFFADAERGDKVVLYASSKTVILYRPKTDTVISKAILAQ